MPDHEQVDTPGWDTKLRCACGFEAATKREMSLHLATFLPPKHTELMTDNLTPEQLARTVHGPPIMTDLRWSNTPTELLVHLLAAVDSQSPHRIETACQYAREFLELVSEEEQPDDDPRPAWGGVVIAPME